MTLKDRHSRKRCFDFDRSAGKHSLDAENPGTHHTERYNMHIPSGIAASPASKLHLIIDYPRSNTKSLAIMLIFSLHPDH